MKIGDSYQCAMCRGTFVATVGDEAAEVEFAAKFPWESTDNREIVCDDCWRKMGLDAEGPAPELPPPAPAGFGR